MLHPATPHTFHIPVMGLAYTLDTPIKTAHYGIASVMSVMDDALLESMRQHYAKTFQQPFTPIGPDEADARARRITAWLNLTDVIVRLQTARLQAEDFTPASGITRYFELLPDHTELKTAYRHMQQEQDAAQKALLQTWLRQHVRAGSIDVNIMAKVDQDKLDAAGNPLPGPESDALTALRGFACSTLGGSLVISAGYNPRLFNYLEQFSCFFPDQDGRLKQKIILKVSDYRSALVQGKILAKKGIWVSGFRIESGLNCGGHAFPTDGRLMGPILEAFRQNRQALRQELFALCNEALRGKQRSMFAEAPEQLISAQGGVGTAAEQRLLLDYYQLDSIGWGSPFLLVPEATTVDTQTLHQLAGARPEDYFLSMASPLGVPFNNFRHSSSEAQRKLRIAKGRPGSPCYKKFLATNTEFTETPICTASRQYQHAKIRQLQSGPLSGARLEQAIRQVTEKDCLCEGLGASALLANELPLNHKLAAVTICPGPNLAYFSGTHTLQQMVDHIYGRGSAGNAVPRPHMFISELKMYVAYYQKAYQAYESPWTEKQLRGLRQLQQNLLAGLEYYRELFANVLPEAVCRAASRALEESREAILHMAELAVPAEPAEA